MENKEKIYTETLLTQSTWDEFELQAIMKEHRIWQPTISSQEMYNETAEQCTILQKKIITDRNDILSACWFAVLMDSLTEFEFTHPEIEWQTEEAREEEEGKVYYQGRRVEFDYKTETKTEETSNGDKT